MNIHVTIERLVLDGITISQRERPLLQAAVEAELARLLTEGGLNSDLQTDGALRTLTFTPIQLADQATDQASYLGQQIAQSLYGGLG